MIVAFTMEGKHRSKTITRTYRKKQDVVMAQAAVNNGPFSYKWPDGSETRIHVAAISSSMARAIRKRNDNFLGYEWMASTIISHGRPMRTKDISQERTS
jgi:hypothetical protein